MIQPIRDNVLCKPFPSDEVSEGGIFVPESCRQVSNKMEVLSVGNGTRKTPMKFKSGQTVYRVQEDGTEVEYNGQKMFLINQKHLLATQ